MTKTALNEIREAIYAAGRVAGPGDVHRLACLRANARRQETRFQRELRRHGSALSTARDKAQREYSAAFSSLDTLRSALAASSPPAASASRRASLSGALRAFEGTARKWGIK